MTMKNISIALFFIILLIFTLSSCGLEQEVDLNLPFYESEMVVECYIEPGKPYRMTLTESAAFFDTPDANLITDAEVTIKNNDEIIPMSFSLTFESEFGKVYTHRSNRLVPQDIEGSFELEIEQPSKGRSIRSRTEIMPKVEITDINPRYNGDTSVLLIIGFPDNPVERNYYRFVVQKDSLNARPIVSFILNDDVNDNGKIFLGTGFAFQPGDTAFISVYHIEKAYYDFLESRDAAISANSNPFGQPAVVKSNVEGGIGIFTNLIYDRKIYVVPARED
jgi:hypothetical protein